MKEIVCPKCRGIGKYMAMGQEPCDKCAGTGKDPKSNLWAKACIKCNSMGKIASCKYIDCDFCRGRKLISI